MSVECWSLDDEPSTYWMGTMNWIHSVLYSYAPFSLLVIINLALLMSLKKNAAATRLGGQQQQHSNAQRRQKSVTITIMITTLSFILFTGSGAVVNFYYPKLVLTYDGNVIIAFADSLCFIFHALNLISLLATNRLFRREFLGLFLRRDAAKAESMHSATTTRAR